VFLVTHDLDTLYTITDRAVLAQKKVLVAGRSTSSETDDAWIHEYFHGPRGRSALTPPNCSTRSDMETRAHHLIGLFTVMVVAGALLFGLWLAKSSVDTSSRITKWCSTRRSAACPGQPGAVQRHQGRRRGPCAWTRKTRAGCWRGFAWVATPRSGRHPGQTGPGRGHRHSIIQLSGGTPQSPALKGKDGNCRPSSRHRLHRAPAQRQQRPDDQHQHAAAQRQPDVLRRKHRAPQQHPGHLEQTTGAIADQRGDMARPSSNWRRSASRPAPPWPRPGADAQRQRPAHDQGKQAIGSAEQAMQSLEQSSATINNLLATNQTSLTTAPRASTSWPRPSANCANPELLRGISQRLEANPSGYLLGSDKNKEFTP
jgi:phospholipid/cholesterol/gamma-HCH transport system substrate-binding protein